jgi:proteic killer suppression protein
MIKSFRGKIAAQVFNRQDARHFPKALYRAAQRKLAMIDAAVFLNDLRVPPSYRLERLKGDRKGQYSIRINDQWRICLRWEGGHAYEVEIVDYH